MPSPSSTISTDSTRILSATGSSSEPIAEELPLRLASQPSTQSVAMAIANSAVAQYSWPSKSIAKRATITGAAAMRATVS